jgi:hypothetical protein
MENIISKLTRKQIIIISAILASPLIAVVLFYVGIVIYALTAWALHEGPLVVIKSLLGIYD